ncbi:MAG: HAD family hydrolase [Actinomycetes bacterium]
MTRRVAAFDFDGTVSKRDTLVPFLVRAAGASRFASVAAQLGLHGARGTVNLRNRDDVKARMVELLLSGRSADELDTLGAAYAQELVATRLRPFMVERLRAHVEGGFETVFVSASMVQYLRPVAATLGVDHVIAVETEVVDGRLTGAIVGPNVRAEEKVVRLRRWLESTGDPAPELWSYGNTSGDHALLEAADHRFWLGKANRVPAGCTVLHPGTPL